MESEFLTPKEVAALLKIRVRVVVDLLRERKLKGVKAGHVWRVRREDLDDYLRRVE
jgi:excisionase family DNA binding protein